LVVVDADPPASGECVAAAYETDVVVHEERLGAQALRGAEVDACTRIPGARSPINRRTEGSTIVTLRSVSAILKMRVEVDASKPIPS
jgi:hypothetical protein